ncbi:MAG: methylenetetrahydrofolate reductase [Francisellaceae bacterium]
MTSKTAQTPKISVEFFPPKQIEHFNELITVADELQQINPSLYTITYGAGGSTQIMTQSLVERFMARYSLDIASHLTCIGMSEESLKSLLNHYKNMGLSHLVVLRGDLPERSILAQKNQVFHYAKDLLLWIKSQYGSQFKITVAAYPEYHPECQQPDKEFHYLIDKLKAGADQAFTQYFFNPDAYFYLTDRLKKSGVDTPVIPGIMPITNFNSIVRFSKKCGVDIPRWIYFKLNEYEHDPASLKAFGYEVTLRLCRQLLEQRVPGLHFYCLNKHSPIKELVSDLSLNDKLCTSVIS